MIFKALSIDPALTNTGLAELVIDTDANTIEVVRLVLLATSKESGKQIRVNSDDLRRAREITEAVREMEADADVVFAEIPSGAQSARAATAFGIATGILAGITKPLIEVMPGDRGKAIMGRKSVSKEEVIHWATQKYPNAGWFTAKTHGVVRFTDKNEHVADAVAIAHAGVKTKQWNELLTLSRLMAR